MKRKKIKESEREIKFSELLGFSNANDREHFDRLTDLSKIRTFIRGYYDLYVEQTNKFFIHMKERKEGGITIVPTLGATLNNTFFRRLYFSQKGAGLEGVPVKIEKFRDEFFDSLRILITEHSPVRSQVLDYVTSSRYHSKAGFIELNFYLEAKQDPDDVRSKFSFMELKEEEPFYITLCKTNQKEELFHITLCKTNQKRGDSFIYETHSSNQTINPSYSIWNWLLKDYKSLEHVLSSQILKYNKQEQIYGTGSFFYTLMILLIKNMRSFDLEENQCSKMISSSCHRSPGAEKLWSRSTSIRMIGNVIKCKTLMRHNIKAKEIGVYCQPEYYLLNEHFVYP